MAFFFFFLSPLISFYFQKPISISISIFMFEKNYLQGKNNLHAWGKNISFILEKIDNNVKIRYSYICFLTLFNLLFFFLYYFSGNPLGRQTCIKHPFTFYSSSRILLRLHEFYYYTVKGGIPREEKELNLNLGKLLRIRCT